MILFYILEGKQVKPSDFNEYEKWKWAEGGRPKIVKQTELPNDVFVSTIFIGVAPVLFETMIFGGEHDMYQERYSTWEDAVAGHQRAIELIYEV